MPEIIHQLSSKDVIFKYANYYKNKDISQTEKDKYSQNSRNFEKILQQVYLYIEYDGLIN